MPEQVVEEVVYTDNDSVAVPNPNPEAAKVNIVFDSTMTEETEDA